MEQRQLAWLITTRSQVRVLVPQPKKESNVSWAFSLVLKLCLGSGTRDFAAQNIVSPRFGAARPRAGIYSEHDFAEERNAMKRSWSRNQERSLTIVRLFLGYKYMLLFWN